MHDLKFRNGILEFNVPLDTV